MKRKRTFSDTLTEEQYNKLTRFGINYERKPAHPDEVHSSINFRDLDRSIIEVVANLPKVEFQSSFWLMVRLWSISFAVLEWKSRCSVNCS